MQPTTTITLPPRLAPWPQEVPLVRRAWYFLAAVSELIWMDVCSHCGFAVLRRAVARVPVARAVRNDMDLQLVRLAVRDGCVFYFKPVKCLQRSSVVTRMLRRRGFPAELVIGYQPIPIESHAWVEIDGRPVWDQLTETQFYRVVDRI